MPQTKSAVPAEVQNFTQNQEDLERLIAAITNSIRWFTLNKDRRKGDEDHALVLLDLLQDLQTFKPQPSI